MAKVIMVQGTMSNAGKSIITAGLLRVFAQDGYKVAPFKSQNMALNSFITKDGLEMGRAQVVQAEAAGVEPDVLMNPILLKPNSDTGSQVIVMGKPIGNMKAKEYFKYKKQLIPTIKEAYNKLAEKYDIIVIEGAGSPAEINLKSDDIVNMGRAEMVDAPVILVGDIDRGGVFAQLYGTVELLPYNEKKRIKGIVINKFRGDKAILENGITMLEKKCHTPVVGVVPYGNIDIDDEDSLSTRLENKTVGAIDIAVIRLPKLSNFTDFSPLEQYGMRYVSSVKELGKPDLIVLGGTKNTIADMKWLNETGLKSVIQKLAENGTDIFGICGGYQLMGEKITDSEGVENGIDTIEGLGLLPVETDFYMEKTTRQITGVAYNGKKITGYEIHQGQSVVKGGQAFSEIEGRKEGCVLNNCVGTYVHGVFDETGFRESYIKKIFDKKGISFDVKTIDIEEYKNSQYDKLADLIRENMDMDKIYEILENKETDYTPQFVLPKDIEARSMEIIESEMITEVPEEYKPIVKRAIHTTADFDYETSLYFSPNCVEQAREAIKRGASIITDTNMAKAGINKRVLGKYGGEVLCFMADEDIAKRAKENGTTRAVASMEKASELEGEYIIAVGNAPTALIKLKELIEENKIKPVLIIAVPVGFVNVVEAKEIISKCNVPVIVARGRKGGSNLAAAICNGILYGIE